MAPIRSFEATMTRGDQNCPVKNSIREGKYMGNSVKQAEKESALRTVGAQRRRQSDDELAAELMSMAGGRVLLRRTWEQQMHDCPHLAGKRSVLVKTRRHSIYLCSD